MRISYVQVIIILLIRNFCYSQFHQDDYDIEQDRIEIPEYNKSACTDLAIKVFKYNETLRMKAINISISIKQEIRKNILLTISLYKNVQRKYRVFPIPNITLDLCEEYGNAGGGGNILGVQNALKLSNFKGCPVVKGFYYLKGWIIEQDKFIPHLPGGDYLLKIRGIIDDDIFVIAVDWYGSIIKKQKKKKH